MISKKTANLILGIAVAACIGFSCDEKNKEGENNFDRQAMLENMATNIIVPNYEALRASFSTFKQSADLFVATTTEANLSQLRTDWFSAYKAWQGCAPFDFGPAMSVALKSSLNTYPTSTIKIENNIFAGTYNLSEANNLDAIGFPAMEYMLYFGTNAEVLAALQEENRQQYLLDLIAHAQAKVVSVSDSWSGEYKATFSESNGTDIGSGLGLIVNDLNKDFELIKNFKIGTPLGKRSLGEPFPEKVEAYYSGNSVELAILNLETIISTYTGDVNGEEGLGLEEHLDAANAQYNNQPLSEAIMAQFQEGKTALEAINGTLSDAIINEKELVETAYTELQTTVTLLKIDMPSSLGVLITYQDNDGD